MGKSRIIFIIFLAMQNLFVLQAQNPQITNKPISIAGQWKFKLDSLNVGIQEEWFKSKLSQKQMDDLNTLEREIKDDRNYNNEE